VRKVKQKLSSNSGRALESRSPNNNAHGSMLTTQGIRNPRSQAKTAKKVVSDVKQTRGGSAWESNPPKTLLMPPNGFEVREAHRDPSAP